MNNNAKPMKIRFPASSAVLEPDKDELLSATDSGDLRVETRRAPCGVEYVVERNVKEERSRAAAALGSATTTEARIRGGKNGGAKGGLSKSPAKLAALAANREHSDGRPPSTPDGIARLAFRKKLEELFGKPLPKDGPVAKLVHKMSSGAVVRRAWQEMARDNESLPEETKQHWMDMAPALYQLMEALAKTLDGLREQKRAEKEQRFKPEFDESDFVPQ